MFFKLFVLRLVARLFFSLLKYLCVPQNPIINLLYSKLGTFKVIIMSFDFYQ